MATPDAPQVQLIQTVQASFVRLKVVGAGTTAATKRVIDEFQEFLKGRSPEVGVYLDRTGDNAQERDPIPGGHATQQVLQPTYIVDHVPVHEHVSSGGPDIEMTSPPPDHPYPQLPRDVIADNPEAVISSFTSRVDELTAENDDLKKALNLATQEATELASKLSTATQERDDYSRQRQTNLQKIKRLNEMIIKSSQNRDEPLDDEVLQDMFRVRNMTTDIIRRFYPGDAVFKPDVAKRLAKRFNDHFYSQFYQERLYPDKNPERRRRLLISLLFVELQHLFFGLNARRFGLPEDMEVKLQELERMIEGSTKVTAEENLDWRVRTVSYIGRLDLSYRETIEACTNRLFYILEPMVLLGEDKYGNPDKREVAGLSNALQDLCSAALKLALRFRSSKTKYEFKAFPDHTSLAVCDDDLIKKLNSEGPISKPMDPNKLRIFCTLFGALVKTRSSASGQPEDPVVLEAGQVIVYEPQRGPPQ